MYARPGPHPRSAGTLTHRQVSRLWALAVIGSVFSLAGARALSEYESQPADIRDRWTQDHASGTILLTRATLAESAKPISEGSSTLVPTKWLPLGAQVFSPRDLLNGAWEKLEVTVRASSPVTVFWTEHTNDSTSPRAPLLPAPVSLPASLLSLFLPHFFLYAPAAAPLSYFRVSCASPFALTVLTGYLLPAPRTYCRFKLPSTGYTAPLGRAYIAVVPESPGALQHIDWALSSVYDAVASASAAIGSVVAPSASPSASPSSSSSSSSSAADAAAGGEPAAGSAPGSRSTSSSTSPAAAEEVPLAAPSGQLLVEIRFSREVDVDALVRLLCGVALLLLAPFISRSRRVHVTSGTVLGALGFVFIVCVVLLRVVPGKRLLITVSSLGLVSSVMAVVGRSLFSFLLQHLLLLAVCLLSGAVAGFAISYKMR